MRLLTLWGQLRSSYWFIPSTMIVGAALLSALMVTLERGIGLERALLHEAHLILRDGRRLQAAYDELVAAARAEVVSIGVGGASA